MKLFSNKPNLPRRQRGFTVEELVISMAVASFTIGGIISGYLLSAGRAEWSAYSLAAQSLTMQRMEQTKAARWDPAAVPAVDYLASEHFPETVLPLDVPLSRETNQPSGTVITTIDEISSDPPLKSVRVDCVWSYSNRGPYTNTIVTLRSPDP